MRVMLSARTVLHPIAHPSHYCFHGFMGLSSFTYKAGKYLPMGKSAVRLAVRAWRLWSRMKLLGFQSQPGI